MKLVRTSITKQKDRTLFGLFVAFKSLSQLLHEHEPPQAHALSPCSWL